MVSWLRCCRETTPFNFFIVGRGRDSDWCLGSIILDHYRPDRSMLRSDLRSTKPAAVAPIKGLLNGDVVFTNLEGAVVQSPFRAKRLRRAQGSFTPFSRKIVI